MASSGCVHIPCSLWPSRWPQRQAGGPTLQGVSKASFKNKGKIFKK